MGATFDTLLEWLKWPVAVVSIVLLPALARALLDLLGRIVNQPSPMVGFLAGFCIYLVLWWYLFHRSRFSLFLTLEHELTHALFALATFHRVTNMRVTVFHGGRMQFVGRGNWLIFVAPYFFPTMSLALMGALFLLPPSFFTYGDALIGATFAFHLTSTLRETHAGQTDIQKTGKLFCLLFLPTANLLCAGIILASSHTGIPGLRAFLSDVVRYADWLGTLLTTQ